MRKEEFFEKVVNSMRERFGEEYNIMLKEIVKNNHVILNGLVIINKAMNVSPTIYLDIFWDAYRAGIRYDRIIDRIEQIYRRDIPQESIDMVFFTDFERVKDRICFEIVNAKENEELLSDIPYIPFLDLAICFYYAYSNEELGEGTILIHNSHIKLWNASAEQLMELAKENTPRLFPWECVSMENVMSEFDDVETIVPGGTEESAGGACDNVNIKEEMDEFLEKNPMHVLSNIKKIHGSVCFLYPGVIDELAEKFGGSIYILPSSVHEVILLADSGRDNPDDLKEMVRVINETQVDPEDILSDSLYYYNRMEKEFEIL